MFDALCELSAPGAASGRDNDPALRIGRIPGCLSPSFAGLHAHVSRSTLEERCGGRDARPARIGRHPVTSRCAMMWRHGAAPAERKCVTEWFSPFPAGPLALSAFRVTAGSSAAVRR
jgi:hypothetical protein